MSETATTGLMMDRLTTANSHDLRCGHKDIVGPVPGGYDWVVISVSMLGSIFSGGLGGLILIEKSKFSI